MRRLVLLVLFVVFSYSPPARGAAMMTSFADVRTQSVTIALGTVKFDPQGNAFVDVDKVLRGPSRSGMMAVKQSPDGHISVSDERVVAFVDGQGALRWVGRLVGGPSIETGVIKLQGFFDRNAHLVEPGLMSLAQLEGALRTGTLTQTFDATFAFPDGRGGLRSAPAKHFTLDYDAMTARITALNGLFLPCLGNPSLFVRWGGFELHLTDTCLTNSATAQHDRSLTLGGELTGLTASGAIAVRVIPSLPVMTEAEYDTFARDRDLASMTNVVRVTLASGASWSWRVDESLVDPHGKSRAAGGWSSTMTGETYEFDDVKITISPGASPGTTRAFLAMVDAGSVTKCIFEQRGAGQTSCTLAHAAPIWVHR